MLLVKLFSVLAIGVAYYIFVRLTGVGVPCIIRLITGKYCPGCGISRMCFALVRGDIETAFRCNMLLTTLLPFAFVFALRRAYIYVKSGETKETRIESVLIIITFVLTVAFWIMRNTETFSFMAPLGAV